MRNADHGLPPFCVFAGRGFRGFSDVETGVNPGISILSGPTNEWTIVPDGSTS
jgi:hypothetical protein